VAERNYSRSEWRKWREETPLDDQIAKGQGTKGKGTGSGLEESHTGKGKGKKGKGSGLEESHTGKGKGKKGQGRGLEESHTGKGKGKNKQGKGSEESRTGRGKGNKGKGNKKGKEVTEEDMEYVRKEMEREIDEGFDPGLQESRGRTYRHLRKLDRSKNPEVQARKALYESGQMERLETRPEPMTEGSQRWRRMKELEAENIKAKEKMQEEREKMQREQQKRLEEYQAKLDQVHQMQLKQTAWMDKMEARERGLGQSQSFGSKPTERGLKKSPGEKKAVLVANTDSKRFEKKPQEEKKNDEESAYEYVTEEEYSAEESSSSEDTHVDPAIGKVDFTNL